MATKSTTALSANVFSQEGKKVSDISLPEAVFGAPWNADLVHGVVVSMRGNARANTAHTKNRGEVRGGGKKPWQQKGTGRARHGSIRSPIWAGGGQAHGPRNERDYSRKINKNVRAKALACVLSKKHADEHLIFVDSLTFSQPKTKEAIASLVALGKAAKQSGVIAKKANATLVVLPARDENTEKSFRNLENVRVISVKDVNPVELLTYKYVVVAKPEESVKALEARAVSKSARKTMAVK